MGEIFMKKPAILFGSIMMVSSITALIVLVLFWPQKNPHSMVKITVESGSSLKEISTLLHEKNIISNRVENYERKIVILIIRKNKDTFLE